MQTDLVSDVSDMEGETMYDDDDFEFIGEGAAGQGQMFDFPTPVYQQITAIGDVNGKTKLQQICDQLYIREDQYVWYNSNQSLKVEIPPELYQDSFDLFEKLDMRSGISRSSNRGTKGSNQQQQLVDSAMSNKDSVLTAKHPKVLLTKETLYIFALKSKQEELEEDQ